MDVAVLTKDAAGELQVERHDTTAKQFAWGGALIGAALVTEKKTVIDTTAGDLDATFEDGIKKAQASSGG